MDISNQAGLNIETIIISLGCGSFLREPKRLLKLSKNGYSTLTEI